MRRNIRISFIFILVFAINFSKVMSQQWGLYTLYATKSGTQAYLIDTADSPSIFKTWTFTSTTKNAYSCYLIPGDTLVRTTSYQASGAPGQGGVTGRVQKITWSGTVAWDFSYSSSTTQLHHDICPMPNGNILMISYDLKTAAEATQAGSSTAAVFWSEKIIEVQPTGATTGTVVWEWKLWDHLCQNYNSAKDNYVTSITDNPQLLNINYAGTGSLPDRFHMNGIDYNPMLNQIVVSMHFMNSVFIIDHSTTTTQAASHTGGNSGKGGDFLYRWGNPASYGISGTANFSTVHDAHWVSSDNQNYPNYLCGYNNQGGTSGKTAIDIWNPPYNGYNYSYTQGSAYSPTTYNYRFNSAFTATNEGNSHQLPNGNMLVCNFQGSIYEVNAAGTNLWTKTSANSTHAYRYTKCYVRAPNASASASSTQVSSGSSVTLNSSATSITESTAAYSYSWSSNSGFSSTDQNPVVSPVSNTTYTVIVTNTAIGCSDTASVTVNVNGSSTLSVNATVTPSIICPGSTVQLNCNPSGGNSYTYQWTSIPAGFTSTLQNPTVIPTINTTYIVTVSSDTNIANNSTSVILYTNPAIPIISQNGTILTSSASSGNQWYKNDTIIQGATANTYNSTQSGNYQVEVTDGNGCKSKSAVLTLTVGISETNTLSHEITIFPNPTKSIINLSVPAYIKKYETQIIDVYGNIIIKNINQSRLDLSILKNGIYFIKILMNGESVQRSKILLNK